MVSLEPHFLEWEGATLKKASLDRTASVYCQFVPSSVPNVFLDSSHWTQADGSPYAHLVEVETGYIHHVSLPYYTDGMQQEEPLTYIAAAIALADRSTGENILAAGLDA